MPLYEFRCERCGYTVERLFASTTERDARAIYCRDVGCRPAKPGGVCRMVLVPGAPAFIINGFSAKNGYTSK